MNAPQYAQQILKLFPTGAAWPREPDSLMARLVGGLAEEPARLDARMQQLLDEADPRTTVEMLPDWERITGLPDLCAGDDQTLDGRRRHVVAALTQLGGQSRAYFIAVALALDYVITITDFDSYDCEADCDAAVTGPAWDFAWQVNAPAVTIEDSTCESFCDEPIRSWGNAVLECVLKRLKPAHTTIIFAYA